MALATNALAALRQVELTPKAVVPHLRPAPHVIGDHDTANHITSGVVAQAAAGLAGEEYIELSRMPGKAVLFAVGRSYPATWTTPHTV